MRDRAQAQRHNLQLHSNRRGWLQAIAVTVLLLTVAAAHAPADEHPGELRFALVFDGPSDINEREAQRFEQSFVEHYDGERSPVFPREHRYEGGWSRESIAGELRTADSNDQVDVIVALGIIASQLVAEQAAADDLEADRMPAGPVAGLETPAIAASLLPRPLQQGGILESGRGLETVIAVEMPLRLERDLERTTELFEVQHGGIIVPAPYTEAIEHLNDAITSRLDTGHFTGVLTVPPEATTETVLRDVEVVLPGVDSVLALPLTPLHPEHRRELTTAFHEHGIATISALGEERLGSGFAAGLRESGLESAAERIAREIDGYLNTGRTFDGAHMPRPHEVLRIDAGELRTAGVEPKQRARLEAEYIDLDEDSPEADGVRAESLLEAARTAVEHNPELAAAGFDRDVADAERRTATSRLLPQIEGGTTFIAIDEERAELPIAPDQFSAVAQAELEQVIWSEAAWANRQIRELLAESEDFQFETARADTAEQAAEAYIDFLQARALVQLRRTALSEQQFNLDRARTREEVGEAGPQDVYRFESETALARQELTEAIALEEQARMELNRVLNRPQRQPVTPQEHDIEAPGDILSASTVLLEAEGIFRLEALEERLVSRALEQSSEIAALETGLSAQERERIMRRRAFYSPTVGLAFEIEQEYWSGGTTAEDMAIDLEEIEAEIDLIDEEVAIDPGQVEIDELYEDTGLQWQAGIRLSIPLFTGGRRSAELSRAEAELSQLEKELESVSALIEQRARTAFVRARSAATEIEQARRAADAAREALDLVSRAYETGMASAAELVDAQQRATEARLLVRNATYDYLEEFVFLLRAIGAADALFDHQAQHEIEQFMQRESIQLESPQ